MFPFNCDTIPNFNHSLTKKIVDEFTDEKLGPHEIGEICFQSPFTMKEYLNNPKVTHKSMHYNSKIDFKKL